MAKSKKKNTSRNKNARKSTTKKAQTDWMHSQLFCLCFLICLMGLFILALGKFGIIGRFIFSLISYFFGNFTYVILILSIAYCGWFLLNLKSYEISKRYYLGIFCLILAALLFSGIKAAPKGNQWVLAKNIFQSTFSILFQGKTFEYGMIGALLAGLFISLFDFVGAYIVMGVLIVLGFVLFFYHYLFEKEHDFEFVKKIKTKRNPKKDEIPDSLVEPELGPSQKESSFINVDENPTSKKKKTKKEIKRIEINDQKGQPKKSNKVESFPLKPNSENEEYVLPPLQVLQDISKNTKMNSNVSSAKKQGQKLMQILEEFNVKAQLVQIHIGPSVTKFEVKPELGVRVSRISSLQDDIKMALAATDIRIEAPIPGKSAVGIEIPNLDKMAVQMKDMMKSIPQDQQSKPLLFCLGKDLMGNCIYGQLDKMPHLLIAGATGSGKSVCVNSIICSILMRTHPEDVKLVLIDPKKVEFTPYNDIPHLLAPVITDGDLANKALKVVVEMMDHRYDLFGLCGVRNISSYNAYLKKHPEEKLKPLPRIVVVIDELADLMLVAAKEVEQSIQRITQLARAAGIYLVVATQRPSVDVITGVIKSNIPSRIAFAVASSVDSRTILDQSGAERLLGNGDMLYLPNGETAPKRIQGVFIQDEEVNQICSWIKAEAKPKYEDAFIQLKDLQNQGQMVQESADPLYDEVKHFVITTKKASTSLIQRKFSVGYSRAARLMDVLEENGIIGPSRGSRPREVLVENTYESHLDV